MYYQSFQLFKGNHKFIEDTVPPSKSAWTNSKLTMNNLLYNLDFQIVMQIRGLFLCHV